VVAARPAAAPLAPAATAAAAQGRFGSAGGVVTLTVGPFADVSSIELFERTLITVEALDDVYLRAYEAGRAIFELTLHHPTELVGELERLAPGVISIVEETPGALVGILAFTPTPAAS
jgi:hypothetical protein